MALKFRQKRKSMKRGIPREVKSLATPHSAMAFPVEE